MALYISVGDNLSAVFEIVSDVYWGWGWVFGEFEYEVFTIVGHTVEWDDRVGGQINIMIAIVFT